MDVVSSSPTIPVNAPTAEDSLGESETPEIKRGLSNIERFYGQSLRGKQRQVLRNLYEGKSVVLRAPTGWGKSRIFQGFRLMLQKEKGCVDPLKGPITIIVTPLVGLGDAQV